MSRHSPLPVLASFLLLLLGCQSDAERARELLEGPGAGTDVAARDALVEATTLDPTLREAWSRLADVELAASRWVEADAAAERAIALSDGTAHEHETRAQAAVALERWDGAEHELTRAIELGAPEAPARTRLGKAQEHLARPDDAIASYRRAIELDPEQLEARLGLARILIGRVETAAEAEAWDGDEPVRTEVRALIEAARAGAPAAALAEEVESLSQDLAALDRRAEALAARQLVGESGILAALGQPGAIVSPFGPNEAIGSSALGSLMGDEIGDSFGFGGLGLRGVGAGGGSNEGTIGLGNLGTIGHGAGTGSGQGYGGGSGRLGRLGAAGTTVTVTTTASGALDAAAAQQVVRRLTAQLRHCYEQALVADPSLSGTQRVVATVTAAGIAESPSASGLGDAALGSCMSRAIARAAFPPASGPSTVTVSVACSPAP